MTTNFFIETDTGRTMIDVGKYEEVESIIKNTETSLVTMSDDGTFKKATLAEYIEASNNTTQIYTPDTSASQALAENTQTQEQLRESIGLLTQTLNALLGKE